MDSLTTQLYKYIGTKITDEKYKQAYCRIVLNKNGKCIRGKNGNMLVQFENGDKVTVLGRMLRKVFEGSKENVVLTDTP